uniref:ZAD domain-containing protein n=2 Tax=Anopheles merus TaxID=30066 RepID=A0A182V5H4_ANOME
MVKQTNGEMATITLPSADCTKFCRFCLSEINLLNVIGPSAAEQESHGELFRLVKTYLKLELVPAKDFPSAVCEMCIALLHDFDTLYQNVHDHRYALRLLLETQKSEDVESSIPVSTIEPNLVEVYEPPPVVLIDTGNNVVEVNTDDQIVLEDGSVEGETNEQEEAQIDVYHVDGQLQHIVMEGGTYIDLQPYRPPKPAPIPIATPVPRSLRTNNVLNTSLPNRGSQMQSRKRTNAANATTGAAHYPKKSTPASYQPVPPTRMLNGEPASQRPSSSQIQRPKVQQLDTAAAPTNHHLYRCPACGNLFVELTNFYNHSCTKAPSQDGVAFASSNSQSQPARTAGSAVTITSEGQRFQCNLCDMSYRTKLQYQKHEYEVHRISNENFGIKCTICHKLFSQRQDYQLHMRAIHPKPGVSFVKIL